MNKKVSLGVTVSLIAVACAITFVLTMTVSLNMYNSMVSGIQERETINAKIKEIDTFVRSSSIYELDEGDLINGIMRGYIDGVEDEYARYYTADEYYKKQQTDSGKIIGTGIVAEVSGDYLLITDVYKSSSADVSEIEKGYVITAIEKKSLLDIGAEAALKQLDGEEGTKISVTVKTPDGTEKTVTLIRKEINLQSVTGELINGYGYIKISTFNETTAEQFSQLVDKFESQSVLGYVFDVRDADTGIIDPLSKMLSRILPKEKIAVQVMADGKEQTLIETDGSEPVGKPVTVIVNSKTACVGELFAVAVRDFAGASVIGMTTMGKGELQTTKSFKDGSAVCISTAMIKPVKSESFDNKGIVPDYTVEMTQQETDTILFADPSTDVQLQKALEIVAAK